MTRMDLLLAMMMMMMTLTHSGQAQTHTMQVSSSAEQALPGRKISRAERTKEKSEELR